MHCLKVLDLSKNKINSLPESHQLGEFACAKSGVFSPTSLCVVTGEVTFPSSKLRMLSKHQCILIDGTRVEVLAEDLMCLREIKIVCVKFNTLRELTRFVTSPQFQGLGKSHFSVGKSSCFVMHIAKSFVINVESYWMWCRSGSA